MDAANGGGHNLGVFTVLLVRVDELEVVLAQLAGHCDSVGSYVIVIGLSYLLECLHELFAVDELHYVEVGAQELLKGWLDKGSELGLVRDNFGDAEGCLHLDGELGVGVHERKDLVDNLQLEALLVGDVTKGPDCPILQQVGRVLAADVLTRKVLQ